VRISHPDEATDLSPHGAGEFPLDAYIAVSAGSEAALASITPRDSSLADGVRSVTRVGGVLIFVQRKERRDD
jgi:hypothetical protein